MSGGRVLFRLALAATLVLWLAMSFWTMPHLSDLGGGPIFDLRFLGYSRDEAQALLDRLGPTGRAFYLGRQQALDWLFPACLGLVLIHWYRRTADPGLAFLLGAVALLATGFDYAENLSVRAMLVAGRADGVELASRMTVLKSAFGGFAILAAAGLLARSFWSLAAGLARR